MLEQQIPITECHEKKKVTRHGILDYETNFALYSRIYDATNLSKWFDYFNPVILLIRL